MDLKNRLIPFKFDSDTLKYCMCPSKFDTFRTLQVHTKGHYRNFICDFCDMGLVSKGAIKRHMAEHIFGVFKCDLCSETFESKPEAHRHITNVHLYKNVAKKFNEKFKTFSERKDHVMKFHETQMKKCNACDRTFPNRNGLIIHTRRDHMMERRYKCTLCYKVLVKATHVKFTCIQKLENSNIPYVLSRMAERKL